ncbi:glutaredoxin family protein [bacterium]|nr:glutaredoxin family protein [candidate division CSSED10-310 bacterium]
MSMDVTLYALSTCGWCKKTRLFLEENGIEYTCIYVDLLDPEEKGRVLDEMARVTPRRVYPTVIVDGGKAVVGFRENELREVLGL